MTKRFPDNLVYGYHGTSDVFVPAILRDGFRQSTKPWDWLGHAIYFWEGDQERAAEWAHQKAAESGGSPVVLRVIIDLSRCFDLTLQKYREELGRIATLVVESLPPERLAAMRQDDRRHDLDCHILNTLFAAARYKEDNSPVFTTVRGLFREGEPLYTAGHLSSGIYDQDHIQIGVLDDSAIEDIEVMYLS